MSVALNIAKFISDIFFDFILSEIESRKNSLISKLKFNKCKKKNQRIYRKIHFEKRWKYFNFKYL